MRLPPSRLHYRIKERRVLQTETFAELIQRVRAGDQNAATELVRGCEPHIHRAVRQPLRYFGLNRVLESSDISQAVLATFFQRRLVFRVPLKHPEQLLRLLVRMARHKLMDEVRKNQATCRDRRRLEPPRGAPLEEAVAQQDASPSKIAAGNELIQELYRRLPADARVLAELRTGGMDWATIANLRGGTPESQRKRLARAIERVAHQMGLGPPVVHHAQ
jgi:RNA polymerase sigma-70 factor (ECF subfamily)